MYKGISNALKKGGIIFLIFPVIAIYSCGAEKAEIGPAVTTTATTDTTSTTVADTTPASMVLAANPSSLSVNGTSAITSTVLTSDGSNVPDGTEVVFSVDDATMATITGTATTNSGVANAALTAQTTPGTLSVTATVGTLSQSVSITVIPPDPGSIEFTSATPQSIGLKSSGQTETSTVIFAVKDTSGGSVVDGTGVDLCLSSGPSGGRLPSEGGEYLNEMDDAIESFTDSNGNGCYDTGESYTDDNSNGAYDSPLHAAVSTVSGVATVILHSGSVSGNVIILATVSTTTLATASPTISIGGGVPSYSHFTVSASTLNLPGLYYSNQTSTITVLVADRFGNANVLEGTTVSYYTESGATESSSSVLDSTGATSVGFRTQLPIPYDVEPESWETTLISRVSSDYGITGSGNPRDGLGTVAIGIVGEEHFDDSNGNGIYDSGETFTDTQPELFVDANDNDSHDDGSGTDPFEIYVDDNGNGVFDSTVNGTWDSSKTLFKYVHFLITGAPVYRELNPSTFTIADGSFQSFTLIVADKNLNYTSSGTTIAVTTDVGTLTGGVSVTLADTASPGPMEMSFTLSDADAGDADAAENTIITVTVVWEGATYTSYFYGTVD